jgi:hypothetical protein
MGFEVLIAVAADYSLLAWGTMYPNMRTDALDRPAAFIFRDNLDDKGNNTK